VLCGCGCLIGGSRRGLLRRLRADGEAPVGGGGSVIGPEVALPRKLRKEGFNGCGNRNIGYRGEIGGRGLLCTRRTRHRRADVLQRFGVKFPRPGVVIEGGQRGKSERGRSGRERRHLRVC
jgi:hypothetical protein